MKTIQRLVSVCGMIALAAALQGAPIKLKPVENKVSFTGEFIDGEKATTAAVARKMPAPSYPLEMRRNQIQGRAIVAYIINEKGVTEQVQVVAATDVSFGEAAVKAVRQWRFKPARKDDIAVRVLVSHPVTFTLGD